MSDTIKRLRRAGNAKVIAVPIGDETFHLRPLSGAERVALFELQESYRSKNQIFGDAGIVAFGLCDEKGNRLGEPEAIRTALLERDPETGEVIDAQVLSELATRTLALSGLTLKSVEEESGNSTASRSSSSGSDSRSSSDLQ